jgi:hypothetical protein
VVTEGGDRLRDGAKVQLPSAAPPALHGSSSAVPGAAAATRGSKRSGAAGAQRSRTHAKPAQ